jgi:hypothetical protein
MAKLDLSIPLKELADGNSIPVVWQSKSGA